MTVKWTNATQARINKDAVSFGIENWNEIGAVPLTVQFKNSWVNFGAQFSTCAFYKDPFGVVHLKGLMKSGTINTVAFTLPSGYRPEGFQHFPAASNGAYGQLGIDATGDVTPQIGNNTYFALNGVTFRVPVDN